MMVKSTLSINSLEKKIVTFENYLEPKYSINKDKGFIIGKTAKMLNMFNYLKKTILFIISYILAHGQQNG